MSKQAGQEAVAPAFISYLRMLPHHQAVQHVLDCLRVGSPDNEAYKLLQAYSVTEYSIPKVSGVLRMVREVE